jgi:hypothetical protein
LIREIQNSDQISSTLSRHLEQFDPIKTRVVVACEADGKTQLYAITSMLATLEESLSHPLVQCTDVTIGLSAGAYNAYGLAIGILQQELLDRFPDTASKLTIPASVSCCCAVTRSLKNITSIYATGKIPDASDKSLENNYDAFTDIASLKARLNDVIAGDPTIPLIDYSLTQITNPVERIIASMVERDLAARSNYAKICWTNVVGLAKIAIKKADKVYQDFEDQSTDQETSQNTGHMRDKSDESTSDESSEEFVTGRPDYRYKIHFGTQRAPVIVVRFSANTTNERMTSIHFDLIEKPFALELSYDFNVPLISYPSKKLSFDTIKSWITVCTKNTFTDEESDNAQTMAALARFLNTRLDLKRQLPV